MSNLSSWREPHFLTALRAAIANPADDQASWRQMEPRALDGRRVRPPAPPSGVTPRLGAVLLAVYPDADGELWLPLTVRSATLRHHRGEIALPGGRIDADDASPTAAALREAEEEIGLRAAPQVWGALTDIYIPPSNFQITPIVAWFEAPPDLFPAEAEVAEIVPLPLRHLLDPAAIREEDWTVRGTPLRIPFYQWQSYKIWGATSLVLGQFAARLRQAVAALDAL